MLDLPYYETFHGCVLFADISGFTTIVEEMRFVCFDSTKQHNSKKQTKIAHTKTV
jgi:hypothetical protein